MNNENNTFDNITLPAGTYFITGTDTDAGKTICTKALLQAAQAQGLSTLAYKPIAAGCFETEQGLNNQDALILQESSSIRVDYDAINPIAFKQPIAPHIAAEMNESAIDLAVINRGLDNLKLKKPSFLFIEGAGGWHLPLNHQQLFSDWVKQQQLPVILVVGLKLGCLNHAILSAKSIQQDGLKIVGWIANNLQRNMPYVDKNIETLNAFIDAPLLAVIPFIDDIEKQDLSPFIRVNFEK